MIRLLVLALCVLALCVGKADARGKKVTASSCSNGSCSLASVPFMPASVPADPFMTASVKPTGTTITYHTASASGPKEITVHWGSGKPEIVSWR